jgi:AraC-like DNA-binding protein
VGRVHDRESGSLAAASVTGPELVPGAGDAGTGWAHGEAGGDDVLSDVLRRVRLTGALFFVVDAATPWVAGVPEAAPLVPILLPGAEHLISYHIVTRGACWGALVGEPPVRLEAGDVLVIPHGDPYVLSSAPEVRDESGPEAAFDFFRAMAAGELPRVVIEGEDGAERIGVVCGFLGCDARPFNPLLAVLPRLIRVRRSAGSSPDPLASLVELVLAESRARRQGSECVIQRLGELLFVEVVRRYIADLPAGGSGWLAGLRDPVVGRALALLHARPAHPWTLDALAKAAAVSRSALAERFAALVGEPPIHYLRRWRLQLAARRLADRGAKVAAVAREVGYDSEAAFSRAFKRSVGSPPSVWRRR